MKDVDLNYRELGGEKIFIGDEIGVEPGQMMSVVLVESSTEHHSQLVALVK